LFWLLSSRLEPLLHDGHTVDILTIIYNGDGSTIYIPTALLEFSTSVY